MHTPYRFSHSAKSSKNRIVLAPMTNTQSEENGALSEQESRWLESRAQGGFGITMTCAARVASHGHGWPGQLSVARDADVIELKKLANSLVQSGTLSIVQIHHAGARSPRRISGQTPVSVVDIPESEEFPEGAAQLTSEQIEALVDDFVQAALRVQDCGFDGVEVHGAHGYLLAQFLDRNLNTRSDQWGGSLAGRARLLERICREIRRKCGEQFVVSLRFSPATQAGDTGFTLADSLRLMQWAVEWGVDVLHASLWDYKVMDPESGKSFLQVLADSKPQGIPLMVAGKIVTASDAEAALAAGADFVALGKIAIANKDWPKRAESDDYQPKLPPYTEEELTAVQVGPRFIEYLKKWPNFIEG